MVNAHLSTCGSCSMSRRFHQGPCSEHSLSCSTEPATPDLLNMPLLPEAPSEAPAQLSVMLWLVYCTAPQVSTPSSMTQLIAEEQQALKELVSSCCPGLTKPDSSAAASPAVAATTGQSWCNTVGQAITYDLRQWYADICHVAPNVCDKDGHLRRLVIPPYALRCPEFPKSLAKFTRLQHVDISYSVAPGSLADVANVIRGLSQLQQLHLRGIGLSGPLSCELVQAGP